MRVLVLNSGSSSLKFRLFEVAGSAPEPLRPILCGMIERIGGPAVLHLTSPGLPLAGSERLAVATEAYIARLFNEGAQRLWVPPGELQQACGQFQRHATSGRPRECDHALAHRSVQLREVPSIPFRPVSEAHRYDPTQWTTPRS